MEETKKPEVKTPEKSEDKPEEKAEVIEEAGSPLDRAEASNKKKEELLEREEKLTERKEKLAAEELVGGRADAGGQSKEETEDQKKVKGATKFFEGTQLEEDIKKANE